MKHRTSVIQNPLWNRFKYKKGLAGLSVAALLASCGGGDSFFDPNESAASVANLTDRTELPIGEAADPTVLSDVDNATPAQSESEPAAIANFTESFIESTQPIALVYDVEHVAFELSQAQAKVELVEATKDQIDDLCFSIAAGADCTIPADTLQLSIPIDVLAAEYGYDKVSAYNSLISSTLIYVREPSEGYDHKLLIHREENGQVFNATVLWDTDMGRMHELFNRHWIKEDGTQDRVDTTLEFIAGKHILLNAEESYEANYHAVSTYNFQFPNDSNNNVAELVFKSNLETDGDILVESYETTATASNGVGLSESEQISTHAGVTVNKLSREEYNSEGRLTAYSSCDDSSGIDCSNTANWTIHDPEMVLSEEPLNAFEQCIFDYLESEDGFGEMMDAAIEYCEIILEL